MSDEQVCAIVIDNGSGSIKAGFAGDDEPVLVFPSAIGVRRDSRLGGHLVGGEALDSRERVTFKYPIERGIISDWDDMEKMWQHTFQHLGISSKERPVLLTEIALNPKAQRENMAQVMFESFEVPAMAVAAQGVLSSYAAGRGKMLAVESGHGVTQVVPVNAGYAISEAVALYNKGGVDVTNYLSKVLVESGSDPRTSADRELVRHLKEKYCYVARDFQEELAKSCSSSVLEVIHQLADGRSVSINEHRFRCPEILFQPSLIGEEGPGIHQVIVDSIMKCSPQLHAHYCNNIILSGNNTLFPGFAERLEKEISTLVPSTVRVKVSSPNAVWIGGSLLASLSTFQNMWISKKEYEEKGPSVIHRHSPSTC